MIPGKSIILCFALALPACSSLDFHSPSPDGARALKSLSARNLDFYGGKITASVSELGLASLEVTSPEPGADYPKRIIMEWDRQGMLRKYEERPLVASINATDPIKAIGGTISNGLRAFSNLAGTVASAIIGGQIIGLGATAAP